MRFYKRVFSASLFLTFLGSSVVAKAETPPKDLTTLTLEELLNTPFTSLAKKEQKLSQTGAAVYVLTAEEIRHSGASSIPELLRLVPGVQVARISTNTYAISIRGFNRQFSNKLLVMMDGRILYDLVGQGTFWEEHDTVIEDIDRIEVVRGPGGTL